MARCKICKTNIPEGTEICNNCQDKKNMVTNESYLDSLLNSVQNTVPATETIYKKKNNKEMKQSPTDRSQAGQSYSSDHMDTNKDITSESLDTILSESEWADIESLDIDYSDLEDFEQYNSDEDLAELPDDFNISGEELFGKDFNEIFLNEQEKGKNNSVQEESEQIKMDQKSFEQSNLEQDISEPEMIEQEIIEQEIIEQDTSEPEIIEQDTSIQDDSEQVISESEDVDGLDNDNTNPDNYQQEIDAREVLEEELKDKEIGEADKDLREDDSTSDKQEIQLDLEDEDFDPDLNELLSSINDIPNHDLDKIPTDMEDNLPEEENPDTITSGQDEQIEYNGDEESPEGVNEPMEEDDDFLSLLNQISSDDPVSEDVKAINDLLQGNPVEEAAQPGMPSNVGEVFSDALKGITALNDEEVNEEELFNQIPEGKKHKGKKKKVKGKKKAEKEHSDQPKKSLLQRLFGNVKDEDVPLQAEDDDKASGESKQAKAETKKESVKKAKKAKKGKPVNNENEDTEGTGKKKISKKNRKDKKENKKKKKEVLEVIDEIEEDEGRINRLGASVVFVLFGLLVILFLVGSNTITYTLSIENATRYFNKQKYNEAYYEVYGYEIKDEDFEIYDKIMTVMFVNKQLNSYNNYYSLGEYPRALDSLLKGLQRYDKYIELATMLGIESDLDYVRWQILAELKNEFKLSEKEAMKIISYEDQKTYSLAVYDVVLENMSN